MQIYKNISESAPKALAKNYTQMTYELLFKILESGEQSELLSYQIMTEKLNQPISHRFRLSNMNQMLKLSGVPIYKLNLISRNPKYNVVIADNYEMKDAQNLNSEMILAVEDKAYISIQRPDGELISFGKK